MPQSLLSTLETMGRKYSKVGLVIPRGSPRYVKGKLSVLQFKVFAK
jgi:hypothetical protein